MAGFADILGGLADIQKGWVAGDKSRLQNEELKTKMALQAIAMQQQQQQQRGMDVAGQALGQIPQQPPMATPQGGGQDQLLGGGGGMPQPQQFGGGLASSLPAPGAVKGSWFGNSPGWHDPSDSGLQASGVPVAGHPGIALPSRATLGQQFDVTFPNGKQLTLPQTDVGPSQDPRKTGGVLRQVDINSPAAAIAGYTDKTFPTNAEFIVKAHHQLDSEVGQNGAALIQKGAPVPAIHESTSAAKEAGREIEPQQWGRSTIDDIKAAINKVAPDASGTVKLIAAGQLSKLLMPEEKMQMQMYFKEHAQAIQVGLAEFKAREAEKGRAAADQRAFGLEAMREDAQAARQKTGIEAKQAGNVSDMQAEWVANYIQTTGTWPVGSGRNQALQNKVEQVLAAKGVDPKAIAQAQGSFKADSTSLAAATKLADATASYEQTALKNLDLATEQIHKAAPTNFGPTINKWVETGQTFAGDTTVPKSVASVITLANEYAKVMSGSTGAMAATDSSRREAAEILNPYFSSGQWDEVSSLIKKEMGNRITSLRDNVDIIRSRIGRGEGATQPTGPAAEKGGAAAPYPSATSVWEAKEAGKLSREEAMRILENQFGVKPQ